MSIPKRFLVLFDRNSDSDCIWESELFYWYRFKINFMKVSTVSSFVVPKSVDVILTRVILFDHACYTAAVSIVVISIIAFLPNIDYSVSTVGTDNDWIKTCWCLTLSVNQGIRGTSALETEGCVCMITWCTSDACTKWTAISLVYEIVSQIADDARVCRTDLALINKVTANNATVIVEYLTINTGSTVKSTILAGLANVATRTYSSWIKLV